MKLTLVEDWDAILKRAWSIKFTILAGLLGVLELVLPPTPGIPKGVLAWAGIVISVALIPLVRVLAQKEAANVDPQTKQ